MTEVKPSGRKYLTIKLFQSRKIGVILPKYAVRSLKNVESDIHFAYITSAQELGIYAQDLSDKTSYTRQENSKFKYSMPKDLDLFVVNGNEPPGIGPNSFELLEAVKRTNSHVLVDIPDCYATQHGNQRIKQWLDLADLIVIHNQTIPLDRKMQRKVLVWPGFPIPEKSYFKPWPTKFEKINILGYRHRQRDLYVEEAIRRGLPLESYLHSNKQPHSVIGTYRNYISKIQNSQIHFANGYVSRKESIVVGRAIETLAAASVLLYETGSDIEYYLEPYRDYIPIINIPDFIEKSLFLLANDVYAQTIATNGKRNFEGNYGSHIFWAEIFKRLG